MEYKEDLRIIRTRKLLSDTLLDMMEESSIEKISVVDLCNRAMVNRATFYAHFEDKYHLLEFALDEIKDAVYKNFTKDFKANSPDEIIRAVMEMAIQFIYSKKSHVARVIALNRNEKVLSTIMTSLAQSIKYQLSKFKSTYEINIPTNLLACFLAGGITNIALFCIDNPTKYTEEEVQVYINRAVGTLRFQKKYY